MLNNELANNPTFWARYEWRLQDDFSYPVLEDDPIRMEITEEACLLVDTGDDFSYISLLFEVEDEEIEIGWDDEAHFHPFVLRIEEWESLYKHLASNHNVAEWIPGLLLRRFVGFTSQLELAAIIEQELALRKQSGLYTEQELGIWPAHSLLVDETYWANLDRKWLLEEPYGWVMAGEDAYSLRTSTNPDFPFAAWNRMIARLKI